MFESSATEALFNQSTRNQHRTQTLSTNEEKEEMIEEFDQEDLSFDRLNLRAFGDIQANSLTDYNASKDSTNKSESWKISKILIKNHQIQGRNATNGYLKIQIADSGCGISQDQIPMLFEMFAQAYQGSRPMYAGTGLGLWICKQLCQKLGGDIKLYSQVGRGTKLVLYIPIIENIQTRPLISRSDS